VDELHRVESRFDKLLNSLKIMPSPFGTGVKSPPPGLFSFDELVLDKNGQLNREKRFPGDHFCMIQRHSKTQLAYQ
jgi:hypothetical protein